MSTRDLTPSTVPTFTCGAVTWSCWVERLGPLEGATQMVWRSACGRLEAWRAEYGRGPDGKMVPVWHGTVDGRVAVRRGTLFEAMAAVATEMRRDAA